MSENESKQERKRQTGKRSAECRSSLNLPTVSFALIHSQLRNKRGTSHKYIVIVHICHRIEWIYVLRKSSSLVELQSTHRKLVACMASNERQVSVCGL